MVDKKELIEKAKLKYKRIFPCGDKKHFSECFTKEENEVIFWFNTEDDTTRVVTETDDENSAVLKP